MKIDIFLERTTTNIYRLTIETEDKSFEDINTVCNKVESAKNMEEVIKILKKENCKVLDTDKSPEDTEIKVYGLEGNEFIEEALVELG